MKNFCICGCGAEIPLFSKNKGEPRRYANGHHRPFKSGYENPKWKGGQIQNERGYFMIKCPQHRFANSGGYIMKHRLIYELYHKCCLLPWIVVDHINKITSDNRLENLRVMTHSEHSRYHATGNKNTKGKKHKPKIR